MVPVGEPGHVADVSQDAGRAGRADPGQVHLLGEMRMQFHDALFGARRQELVGPLVFDIRERRAPRRRGPVRSCCHRQARGDALAHDGQEAV